jgi:hypothetical protein
MQTAAPKKVSDTPYELCRCGIIFVIYYEMTV